MPTLTLAQIRSLWLEAGGPAASADVAAAVAMAESSGDTAQLNDNPATRDYSVGLWQINYFGDLRAPRTAAYGSPLELIADPLKDARAAVDISRQGSDFTPWTMYRNHTYLRYLPGGSGPLAPPTSGVAGQSSGGASGLRPGGRQAPPRPIVGPNLWDAPADLGAPQLPADVHDSWRGLWHTLGSTLPWYINHSIATRRAMRNALMRHG